MHENIKKYLKSVVNCTLALFYWTRHMFYSTYSEKQSSPICVPTYLLDAQCQLNSILWNHSGPSVRLSVCSPVCPSFRLSLNALKTELLVFSDILLDDSRQWYLVTDLRFPWNWKQWVQIWAKNKPQISFFVIFSSLVH